MTGHLQEAILIVLANVKDEVTTSRIYDALEGKHVPLAPSSIFIALERMSKKNLVTRRRGEPIRQRGGKAQIYYKITRAGRAAVRRAAKVRKILDSLSHARTARQSGRHRLSVPRS